MSISTRTSAEPGRDAPSGDDAVQPFAVEALEVRGRVVRLAGVVDDILSRHDYPPSVSRLLGEAIALGVLLGSSLKIDGRFILQTQSDGPIRMMVVDYTAPGSVRACAKFDAASVAAAETGGNVAALLGRGHLAMTIDQGPDMNRFQGVVPLEGQTLAEAADLYFRQSEQIPTHVSLAVAERLVPGAQKAHWRAGGLLLQYLPREGGLARPRDLPPGDVPAGIEMPVEHEDDTWREARLLAETVEVDELIDPTISPQRLLYRLFHERGVRVFEPGDLKHECRCSRPRVEQMLSQFTAEERTDMLDEHGNIIVTCEFCSTTYDFDPKQFD